MTIVPIHAAFVPFVSGKPSLWSEEWSWEPGIVIPMSLCAAVYGMGAMRRGRLRRLAWSHTSFAAGWLSLFLALTSPIHELGEQLFSVHMLQHEIMILISAPLIAAAQPAATFLWAFAPRQRSRIGAWMHRMENSQTIRFVSAPLNAWILEVAALWLWHIPALYQATLRSNWIHGAQHLSFLLTAVLFWSA